MQVETKLEIRVMLTTEEWSLIGRALGRKLRNAETAKAAELNVQLQERLLQRHQEMLQVAEGATSKAREVMRELIAAVNQGTIAE